MNDTAHTHVNPLGKYTPYIVLSSLILVGIAATAIILSNNRNQSQSISIETTPTPRTKTSNKVVLPEQVPPKTVTLEAEITTTSTGSKELVFYFTPEDQQSANAFSLNLNISSSQPLALSSVVPNQALISNDWNFPILKIEPSADGYELSLAAIHFSSGEKYEFAGRTQIASIPLSNEISTVQLSLIEENVEFYDAQARAQNILLSQSMIVAN